MDPKNIFSQAKRQLDLANLDQVFDLLIQFAETAEDDLIERFRSYKQRYQLLKSDLNDKTISYEKFSELRSLIIQDLNRDLRDLSEQPDAISDPQERVGIDKINYGRIVHNIPSRMPRGIRKECKVRIAKNDIKLLEGFDQSDLSKPDTLEITGTMEVEIKDPGNGKFFTVESESVKEQIVEDHTYTQWVFYITPLIQGAHPLKIRAYLRKNIEGKEKLRELSFESFVEVVATDQIEYSKMPITPYTDSGKIIVLPSSKKIAAVPVIPFKKPEIGTAPVASEGDVPVESVEDFDKANSPAPVQLKKIKFPIERTLNSPVKSVFNTKILMYALIVIGLIGIVSIFQLSTRKSTVPTKIGIDTISELGKESKTYMLGIKFDPAIGLKQVMIDKQAFKDWTTAGENSLIFLHNLPKGLSFKLELEGHFGNCITEIVPPLESDIIEIKCSTPSPSVSPEKESKPPSPDTKPSDQNTTPIPTAKYYDVELIIPIKDPVISLDGKIIGLKSKKSSGAKGTLKFSMLEGYHSIKIEDRSGMYVCDDKKVNIQNDQSIRFECKPRLFNVILQVDGFLIKSKANELYVKVDGEEIKIATPTRIERSWIIRLNNITAGNHTLEVGSRTIRMIPCKVEEYIKSDETKVYINCGSPNTPVNEPEIYALSVKFDPAIKANEVRINEKKYADWTANRDTSIIVINNLRRKVIYVLYIAGTKGSCSTEVSAQFADDQIEMKCQFFKQNPPNQNLFKRGDSVKKPLEKEVKNPKKQ